MLVQDLIFKRGPADLKLGLLAIFRRPLLVLKISLEGSGARQVHREVYWTDALFLEHFIDPEHLVKLFQAASLLVQPAVQLELADAIRRFILGLCCFFVP